MNLVRGFLLAASVAGAVAVGSVGAQAAEAGRNGLTDVARAYPGESYAQYRRYGYRGGYRRRGYGGGAAAAGIAGLAAGALVAGAIASQQPAYGQPVGNVYGHDPNWVNYCASRYRSFDPASGTFLGNDGVRYRCQ